MHPHIDPKQNVSPQSHRPLRRLKTLVAVWSAVVTAVIAGPAWANPTWITCTPVGVATYQGRVHVHCAASVGGISYFAASTSDSGYAARILSLAASAQVAGRTLDIEYDPNDRSGTSIGCLASDCRLIQGISIR